MALTYKEKLLDPRWQRLRLEVLNQNNFCCETCGDSDTTLHVHHESYAKSGNPWDTPIEELRCYCKHCHSIIEYNKKSVFAPHFFDKSQLESSDYRISCYYQDSSGDFLLDIYLYRHTSDDLRLLSTIRHESINRIWNKISIIHKKIERIKKKRNKYKLEKNG